MMVIIQEILFPLMCHTDEDDDLFENDPIEYIKLKYGIKQTHKNNECVNKIYLYNL